jgi:hypothetical protein
MPKKENPELVESTHRIGKYTGYDLINGEYHLAPQYVQQFNDLFHREKGIEELLKMVAHHAQEDLTAISKEKQGIWVTIGEDLGIDVTANGNWRYSNGIIKKSQEEK